MPMGRLLSFRDISSKFQLPRWMFFLYPQLRHAARAQFSQPPIMAMDPIEEHLAQGSLPKPLSSLYLALLSLDTSKMDSSWEAWKEDIPSLDRENWEDCFESSSKLVISSRDKLIQTKFLHRVYYNPQRLQRFYSQRYPVCVCCHSATGTYFHMFWSCPRVTRFQTEVFEVINTRLQLSFPMSPELALLGLQDNDQGPQCV